MMKLQLSRRVTVACGFFRLFRRRKYLRWLFALFVFIVLIIGHIKVGREYGNNFVELKFGGQVVPPKNATSNIKGSMENHQNSKVDRTGRMFYKEHLLINTAKTIQNDLNEQQRCLSWCNKSPHKGGQYFLSAVLLVRIYSSDLAKLSTRELLQWLYYLRYAGFEHVYVYDAYVSSHESQKNALEFLVTEGFVSYVDWSHNASPYSVTGTQESAYQDCLKKWGHQSKWQASIDIDEYPFCPQDTKPNFMQRFIANFSRELPDVSQITMQNFLFLGTPLNDTQHPFLIDRLKRRTRGPSNALVKPIYKTSHVKLTHVHHHDLRSGIQSVDANQNKIRLNHYWGARLQNWGEDTPDILAKTTEDNTMQEIVKNLLSCDHVCLPSKSIIYVFRWN